MALCPREGGYPAWAPASARAQTITKRAPEGALCLFPKPELRDQVQIALTIGCPEIVQQRATLVDEHQQAAARMVVLRVGLEMLGEVADALGEDRHLHLGRTGVALGAAMFLDEREIGRAHV